MNINLYADTIAITGIIGSGKSTISDLLEKRGAYVIRADVLSAAVLCDDYENYREVKQKICILLKRHGKSDIIPQIFPEKGLNRKALGEAIFQNSQMTKELGEIIHPEVKKLFETKVSRLYNGKKIIIYDVPLLFETGLNKIMKKNIVVYAPENIAIQRAALRLGISEEEVKKRLNHQISIEKKMGMADYVINNSGNLDQLHTEVDKLWKYLQDIK